MKPTDDARKPVTLNRPDLPHGALSQIARRLRPHVTPQHVREVYFGRRSSPRVERAIETYLARLARGQQERRNAESTAA